MDSEGDIFLVWAILEGRVFQEVGPGRESVSILSRNTRPALAETELCKRWAAFTLVFDTFSMYFAT